MSRSLRLTQKAWRNTGLAYQESSCRIIDRSGELQNPAIKLALPSWKRIQYLCSRLGSITRPLSSDSLPISYCLTPCAQESSRRGQQTMRSRSRDQLHMHWISKFQWSLLSSWYSFPNWQRVNKERQGILKIVRLRSVRTCNSHSTNTIDQSWASTSIRVDLFPRSIPFGQSSLPYAQFVCVLVFVLLFDRRRYSYSCPDSQIRSLNSPRPLFRAFHPLYKLL